MDQQGLLGADGAAALVAGAGGQRGEEGFAGGAVGNDAHIAQLHALDAAGDLQGIGQVFAAAQGAAVEAHALEQAIASVDLGGHQGGVHALDGIDLAALGNLVGQYDIGAGEGRLGGEFGHGAQAGTQQLAADGIRGGHHAIVAPLDANEGEAAAIALGPQAAIAGLFAALLNVHAVVQIQQADLVAHAIGTGGLGGDQGLIGLGVEGGDANAQGQGQHQRKGQGRHPGRGAAALGSGIHGGFFDAELQVLPGRQASQSLIGDLRQLFKTLHRASPPFKMISSFFLPRLRREDMVPSGSSIISAISAMPKP